MQIWVDITVYFIAAKTIAMTGDKIMRGIGLFTIV